MGVGTPLDLLEAVHRGVDMFDCIIPTQVAQRGGAFTSRGYLQMRRTVHAMADLALDPDCDCPTCPRHSRAYLHHLIKVREPLGWQLLGQHNLHFYHHLMREMRESILADGFADAVPREAGSARRRRPGQPREAIARTNAPRVRSAFARGLRRAHGACGLREHPPRRLGRDHARAHPAHGRGPEPLRRAVGPARAAAPARRRGSGDRGAAGHLGRRARRRGQCDGGDPLLRGRRRGRTGARTPRAAYRQLRDRPRSAPAGAQKPPSLSLPAPRRAGGAARHRGVDLAHPPGPRVAAARRGLRGDGRAGAVRPGPGVLRPVLGLDAPGGLDARDLRASARRLRRASRRALHLHRFHGGARRHAGRGLLGCQGAPHRRPAREHDRPDGRRGGCGRRARCSRCARCVAAPAAPPAVTDVAQRRHDLLGPQWLERWGRSQARFPSDVAAGEHAAFAQRIREHLQFRCSTEPASGRRIAV